MRTFLKLTLLALVGAQTAYAEVPGSRVVVACTSSKGETVEQVLRLSPVRTGASIFSTRGDGALRTRFGRRTIRKVFTTSDGLSLHMYLIAAREGARTTPLGLRRVGMMASKSGQMVGAPNYFTFQRGSQPLSTAAAVGLGLDVAEQGESFMCHLAALGVATETPKPRRRRRWAFAN